VAAASDYFIKTGSAHGTRVGISLVLIISIVWDGKEEEAAYS
jgi:hypothetical protein